MPGIIKDREKWLANVTAGHIRSWACRIAKNPPEKRFWKFVDKQSSNECWPWTRGVDGGGYGMFRVKGLIEFKAHRISWFLTYGKIPKGIQVCHHCDNPPCCNPMHLFLGDYYANMKDSIQKGRQPIVKGENHLNAKLNDADVVQIRELYKGGFTQLKIAKAFGIGQDGVSRIVNRKLWSHI